MYRHRKDFFSEKSTMANWFLNNLTKKVVDLNVLFLMTLNIYLLNGLQENVIHLASVVLLVNM